MGANNKADLHLYYALIDRALACALLLFLGRRIHIPTRMLPASKRKGLLKELACGRGNKTPLIAAL